MTGNIDDLGEKPANYVSSLGNGKIGSPQKHLREGSDIADFVAIAAVASQANKSA